MLVNTSWLLDYLVPHCSHADLLKTFTAAGLEVEETHEVARELDGVVVGFVREKQVLPNDDGLFHCRIEVAKNRLIDVICASEHEVQIGWGIPVATAGTVLPTGAEIRAANYHGVHSEGMICLDGEMGMVARESGLHVFDDETLLGKPFSEVVEISEWLVELAILPNRPDCLGMVGIARELAAALGLQLKYPVTAEQFVPMAEKSVVPVTVDDPKMCPRYLGQVLRGVQVGPSPQWLKSRLLTAGKRPISNVVDVTNFVLLEWGQPLHAFDLATLHGGEIQVRNMRTDEQLELLDGTVLKGCDAQPLVVADGKRPVALAGIMGGTETQTTDATTDVLVEAACFDPVTIRHNAKKLGVTSDSSYRFERGTDPNRMLSGALSRAVSLIAEMTGGTLDGACTEFYPEERTARTFQLQPEQFSKILGMPVDAKTIQTSLEKLEMRCSDDLQVVPPTWRVDVNDRVVLIEDVARLVGYDTIPLTQMTATSTAGRVNPLDQLRNDTAAMLVANGFFECRKAPLRPESDGTLFRETAAIRLQNPMRNDMTVLRTSLIPSLLEVVEQNARRGADSFRFFEIDRAFHWDNNLPVETWSVALAIGGAAQQSNWKRHGEAVDFFYAKGVVENLLEQVGLTDWTFAPLANQSANQSVKTMNGFTDGQTAEIIFDGDVIGLLGCADSSCLGKSKLRTEIFVAELNLQAVLDSYSAIRSFQGLSRMPAITRDLAIVVPHDVQYADLETTARTAFSTAATAVQKAASNDAVETKGPRLEQVSCIDLYQGKGIADGGKSLAVRLVFREPNRTLTSEEAAQLADAVTAALAKEHAAVLRG